MDTNELIRAYRREAGEEGEAMCRLFLFNGLFAYNLSPTEH